MAASNQILMAKGNAAIGAGFLPSELSSGAASAGPPEIIVGNMPESLAGSLAAGKEKTDPAGASLAIHESGAMVSNAG